MKADPLGVILTSLKICYRPDWNLNVRCVWNDLYRPYRVLPAQCTRLRGVSGYRFGPFGSIRILVDGADSPFDGLFQKNKGN
jgi:hypothetical protein